MDPVDINGESTTRITRQSRSRGVFTVEVRPRAGLKRKKAASATVNGSEAPSGASLDEEGSPDKIFRLQESGEAEDENKNKETSKEVEMDNADHTDDDINMSSEDEGESRETFVKTGKPVIEEESVISTVQVGLRETEEVRTCLQRQRNIHQHPQESRPTGKHERYHISVRDPAHRSRASSSAYAEPLENRQNLLTARSSIRQYQDAMGEKARASAMDHPDGDMYPYLKRQTTFVQETNHVTAKRQQPHRNAESKNRVITRHIKATPASSSRAYVFCGCGLLQWALVLLASLTLSLLGYQHLLAAYFPSKTTEHQQVEFGEAFEAQLAALKPLFQNQRPELWKRTGIHIKQHFRLTQPSQPVTLILTSGRVAERTLGCLARKIASAFSTAFNTSVLDFDGAGKAAEDSDEVKMDIDKALKKAFEGGQHAAIIHHFDKLPPASTLIFYRYCDHENAAYKNVFLTFTVLLPVDEIDSKLSLSTVEEQVHEYVKEKFVSREKSTTFNQMDVDKLGGLWSRISHLVLPVAAEQTIEQQGCGGLEM